MKTLETERLILRQWREGDETDVFAYASGDKVGPMAGWKPHETVQETKALLSLFRKENETWAIVLKETGRVIGSVGLHAPGRKRLPVPYDFELGYVLSESCWGRGFIPEAARAALCFAFEERNARAVTVSHFPFNLRSKRVIEKLGFRPLCRIPNSWLRYDGVLLDECVYLLTREEFFRGSESGNM